MKKFLIKLYIIGMLCVGIFSFFIEDKIIHDDKKKLMGYSKDPKIFGSTVRELIQNFKVGIHEFSAAGEFEIIGFMFFLFDPSFCFYGSLFYLISETYDIINKGHEYGGFNDLLYAMLTSDEESILKIGETPKETYLDNRVPIPERLSEEEKALRLEELAAEKKKAYTEEMAKIYEINDDDLQKKMKEMKEQKLEELARKRRNRGIPGNRS